MTASTREGRVPGWMHWFGPHHPVQANRQGGTLWMGEVRELSHQSDLGHMLNLGSIIGPERLVI